MHMHIFMVLDQYEVTLQSLADGLYKSAESRAISILRMRPISASCNLHTAFTNKVMKGIISMVAQMMHAVSFARRGTYQRIASNSKGVA